MFNIAIFSCNTSLLDHTFIRTLHQEFIMQSKQQSCCCCLLDVEFLTLKVATYKIWPRVVWRYKQIGGSISLENCLAVGIFGWLVSMSDCKRGLLGEKCAQRRNLPNELRIYLDKTRVDWRKKTKDSFGGSNLFLSSWNEVRFKRSYWGIKAHLGSKTRIQKGCSFISQFSKEKGQKYSFVEILWLNFVY